MIMTPEQLRVVAAREAIGKFGVPYGPDAVAFATATEGFEEVVGRQKDREEREVGVRHDTYIRGGMSVDGDDDTDG